MAAVEARMYRPRKQSKPKQVLSKWKDLEGIGCSQSALAERLSEIYQQVPRKVFLNDEVCAEYGHFCYTTQGAISHSVNTESTVITTGESKVVKNDSSQPQILTVQLKSLQKAGVSITVSKGGDFSAGQTIPLSPSDLGLSNLLLTSEDPISIENTIGYTCDHMEEVKVAQDIRVSLNPGQKAVIVQEILWTELRGEFSIPFSVEGWCMSLFEREINGQRVWLHELSSLFDLPMSQLQGQFVCVCDIRGSVNVQTQ